MITKENVYKIAFAKKSERIKKIKYERDKLLSNAYRSVPRLYEIDRLMNETGALIAVTAISDDKSKLLKLRDKSKALTAEKNIILEKFNVPEARYECEACADSGYIHGKICDCIRREASRVILSELSKEMPLGECTFENFDLNFYSKEGDGYAESPFKRMSRVYNVCREYVRSFEPNNSQNLLFLGDTGLGKTHLTLSIVYALAQKGYLPVYGSAENLFTLLETERFSGEERTYNNAALNCDLLVIDDLGTEFSTNFTRTTLYNLINTRLLTKKPTIINTNLTIREIEERYTARVASRIIGNYDAYKFIGKDIRQLKKFI